MLWLFAYIILAAICGHIARNKGYSFYWAFFLSLIITPLIGLLLVISNTPNKPRCVFCRGYMEKDATTCLHCGKDQPANKYKLP